MAQTGIRKGFFFYFGLLILVAVAVLLVSLTIMMFSPGTHVLWMQYFTYNDVYKTIKNTDDEDVTNFSWDSVDSIIVNAKNYANIIVEVDTHPNLAPVTITNVSKGFASAKETINASYKIELNTTERKLNVNVDVPTGFLNISENFTIVLNGIREDKDFTGKSLKLATETGNITIGAGETIHYKDVAPSKLDLTTTSGTINLNAAHFDTRNLNELKIKTSSGAFDSTKKDLKVSGDVVFKTENGTIDIKKIDATGKTVINNTAGNFVVHEAMTSNKIEMNDCQTGRYDITKVTTDQGISWTASEDELENPYLIVKDLNSNLVFSSSTQSRANITIENMRGNVEIIGTKAKLTIKNIYEGKLDANVDTANVSYGKNAAARSDTDTINALGDVYLTCKNALNRNIFVSTNGNITVDVSSEFKFTGRAYKSYISESENETKDDKITCKIGGVENVNPVVTGTDSTLTLVTAKNLLYTVSTQNA